MTPGPDESKSPYALALAHYESVGKELEGSIGDIVRFHAYRNPWFDSAVQRPASYLACGLGGVVYLALAWAASWHLSGRLKSDSYWWVFYLVYAGLAFVSLWAVKRLFRSIPPRA